MYETKGRVDEAMLREMGSELLPVWQHRLMLLLEMLALAMLVFTTVTRRYGNAAFMLLLATFLIAMEASARMNVLRANLKRMEETAGARSVCYVVRFCDDAVEVENISTCGSTGIPYGKFVRMCEIEDAYILFTEGQQIVPVFKNGLADCDAFLSYLADKPTRIKNITRK